jgi:hypothetical protein
MTGIPTANYSIQIASSARSEQEMGRFPTNSA